MKNKRKPTRRQQQLFVATAIVGTAAVIIFSTVLTSRLRALAGVHLALWYEPPSGPALIVSGHRHDSGKSGPSSSSYGWILIDAKTGAASRPEWFAKDREFATRDGSPRVLATSGAHILYRGSDGLHLREGVDGTETTGASLMQRWPSIAQPWHQSRVIGPGTLAIEADDRRWWAVDIAGRDAKETSPPPAYAGTGRCVTLDWPQADGKVWTFDGITPERHSDPNRWALVRATRLEYAKLADVERVGLTLPYAWFHCDERTRKTAMFADGSALIGVWAGTPTHTAGVAKLSPSGAISWTRDMGVAVDSNLVQQVFGHEGGFLVLTGMRVTSLGDGGEVRWQTNL